jgi:hypothetical protein
MIASVRYRLREQAIFFSFLKLVTGRCNIFLHRAFLSCPLIVRRIELLPVAFLQKLTATIE